MSLELDLAMEIEYKVVKIHEVWHFQDRTNRLFRGCIDMFLKKKQEASGWPGWCQTEEDKERYLQEYRQRRDRPRPQCHTIQCRRTNGEEVHFKQLVGENGSTP